MPNPTQKNKLGELIFVRKLKVALIIQFLLAFIACVFISIGIMLIFANGSTGNPVTPGQRMVMALVGIAMIIFPTGLSVYVSFYRVGEIFKFYEHGVTYQYGKKKTKLSYDKLESFVYTSSRNSYEDISLSKNFKLILKPTDKSGLKPITYQQDRLSADEDITKLCEYLTEIMYERMLQELQQVGELDWDNDYRFLRKGLYCPRKNEYIFKSEPGIVPYKHLVLEEEGSGFLLKNPENKRVGYISRDVENYFPGILLLNDLISGKVRLNRSATTTQGEQCDIDFS